MRVVWRWESDYAHNSVTLFCIPGWMYVCLVQPVSIAFGRASCPPGQSERCPDAQGKSCQRFYYRLTFSTCAVCTYGAVYQTKMWFCLSYVIILLGPFLCLAVIHVCTSCRHYGGIYTLIKTPLLWIMSCPRICTYLIFLSRLIISMEFGLAHP
jgi:hypothetical protein